MSEQFIPQRNNWFEVHFNSNMISEAALQSLTLAVSSVNIQFNQTGSTLIIKFYNYRDLGIYQILKDLCDINNINQSIDIEVVTFLPDGSDPQIYASGTYMLSELSTSMGYSNLNANTEPGSSISMSCGTLDINTIYTKFIQVAN